MDAYKQPPKTLPRSPGNEREWLEFEGLVTETLLLGNIAALTGEKITWDRANMKANNSEFAQKYIRPDRRKGWDL
jgi:hypothetical protein